MTRSYSIRSAFMGEKVRQAVAISLVGSVVQVYLQLRELDLGL